MRELFERILDVCEHPLIAYHIPGLAPAVAPSIVADLPLWGAKDSGGDIAYTDAVIAERQTRDGRCRATAACVDAARRLGRDLWRRQRRAGAAAQVCAAARDGRIDDAQRVLDVVVRLQRAIIDAAPDMEWIAAFKSVASSLHGGDLGGVRIPLKARREYSDTCGAGCAR